MFVLLNPEIGEIILKYILKDSLEAQFMLNYSTCQSILLSLTTLLYKFL